MVPIGVYALPLVWEQPAGGSFVLFAYPHIDRAGVRWRAAAEEMPAGHNGLNLVAHLFVLNAASGHPGKL